MHMLARLTAILIACYLPCAFATNNQTDDLSPILSASSLPFRVSIEKASFQLPVGFHSGVVGVYHGLWIFIAGRINGLHGFGSDPFPADKANKNIYVVDPATGKVWSRALSDPSSGLSQKQIDTLTVTSPQGCQAGHTLYMTGGYGLDSASHSFMTQPVLTAIYLPGIVQWVMHPEDSSASVARNISQLSHPFFQVTGGSLFKAGDTFKMVFGQNFTGSYTPGSNGNYIEQVRLFKLGIVNGHLSVSQMSATPSTPNPNYRRRDLNVVPALLRENNLLKYGFVAFSGVFTQATGIWTVPVIIDQNGHSVMADPSLSSTFKQAMNHYVCATAGLYSRKTGNLFTLFFGGMSYGYYSGGSFQTDSEIPFINQVTAIRMDGNGQFTQYLMDSEYPVILSTGSNPGNRLLFGAGAYFMPANISHYPNKIINLDNIRRPTTIGYIVGGIQSTLANTNVMSDSAASPYVFKVTLVPTG